MIEPRLASHILVAALRRQAEAQGAFATLLQKGDATSGTIWLVKRENGREPALFEPLPSLTGTPVWSEIINQDIDKEAFVRSFIDRQAARDPDIWIIELDVPFAERFTAIVAAVC